MKKIDIHVHTAVRRGAPRHGLGDTYCTPDELLEIYDRLGIDIGVILPMVNPECGIQVHTLEEAEAITHGYGGRFRWFCNIDPRAVSNSPGTDFGYYLRHYKRLGAKGVGEICANMPFDDPLVENLFYHCEQNEMPVIFHIGPTVGRCYGLVDGVGLPKLEKALAKFPGLLFLGHSQPFWGEIGVNVDPANRNAYPTGRVTPGRVVELMRKYSNLCGDLSANSGYNAVSRDPEYGCAFMEEFQDRLYFGTDICAPGQERLLSLWMDEAFNTGKLSRAAYEKIGRKNAAALLGL